VHHANENRSVLPTNRGDRFCIAAGARFVFFESTGRGKRVARPYTCIVVVIIVDIVSERFRGGRQNDPCAASWAHAYDVFARSAHDDGKTDGRACSGVQKGAVFSRGGETQKRPSNAVTGNVVRRSRLRLVAAAAAAAESKVEPGVRAS